MDNLSQVDCSTPGDDASLATVEEAGATAADSPPAEAVLQPDGSYVMEGEDGSMLRWTKRQDGSWRRPERRRAGWVGDLERQKYSPPPLRDTQEGPLPSELEVATAAEASSAGTAVEAVSAAAAAGNGSSELGRKHDLQRRWCLWVRQRPGPHWVSEQNQVHEFDTVEDYWCMIHYSHPPSRLENVEYSVFHHKVKPVEKETIFRQGGRWIVQLEATGGRMRAATLDEVWRLLSMTLVGEGFAELEGGSEIVRGASLTVRLRTRGSRAALWLSDVSEANRVLAIGEEFRNYLLAVPGLEDLVARFEDFRKQEITQTIPQPAKFTGKSTAGIFQ